jgi:hypothetical protein
MSKDLKNVLLGAALALFLIAGIWGGYRLYPSLHPCNTQAPDTIYVHDTVFHYIPDTIPYYIVKLDSIVYRDTVFKDVDTAAILKDYYAPHYYERIWRDTALTVILKDVIAENKSIANTFTYQITRPQQIIIQQPEVTYSRYITFGAGLPFKNAKHMTLDLDLTFVTPKYYFGAGYNGELNCPSIKAGVTVARFY